MRIWYSKMGDTQTAVFDTQSDKIYIGRGATNDIVLKSPFVAEQAVLLTKSGTSWELVPLGENEVLVGRQRIQQGERTLVRAGATVQIYPFSLTLDSPVVADESAERLLERLDDQMAEFTLAIHRQLLERMDVEGSGDSQFRADDEGSLLTLENDIDELARLEGFGNSEQELLVAHCAGRTVHAEIISAIVERAGAVSPVWSNAGRWQRFYSSVPDMESELKTLAANMVRKLELDKLADISEKTRAVEKGYWTQWKRVSTSMPAELRHYLARRWLKKQIKDIVFGYGPLEDLLRMPNISEIMVVDRDKIYIEKDGVLEKSGRRFVSDDVTISIIDRIVSRVGRRIDKSQPLVDARLIDGSRVNAVIPPVAVSGPCLTIRKFPSHRLRMDGLVQRRSLSATVAEFLKAVVVARCNILVSGGTGSGKTTLLNCLSDFIPDKERIVTIEDTAELQLKKEHVVRMETKSANVEGTGAYTIRDLVRNSLRMRPDRIIVGECSGPEALDMLQAMNTGHDGSMTTIHANSAADVILRLEVLVQMAADLPVHSIHRQIASAVDLVIQLDRLRDGRRVVSQVTEFVDYDPQESRIRCKDLFLLEHTEAGEQLMPTGALPTFMGELLGAGLIDLDAFYL